jgi:type I restriction enzyme R subunit
MLEKQIEDILIEELKRANYVFRDDIHDRKTMEDNFREKFNKLNHVNLLDVEFRRLLEQITTSDVFEASRMLREREIFFREDGIPLQFSLVNTKDWCKNDYEVVRQLRINTQNSFQRYDVILLINGLPVVQVELKTLDVSPRRAIQQIVDYKRDTGNGYTNS